MAEPTGTHEALRLIWCQTWPEKDADWSAQREGYAETVGRIYMDKIGILGRFTTVEKRANP
jgi:hypothetical protein